MTAGSLLETTGLLSDELLLLVHPIDPDRVTLRPAPALIRRVWGNGIAAMTIGSTVFIDPMLLAVQDQRLGRLVVHELVHVRQWHDHGRVGFLIRYLAEYVKGRIRGHGHREAYLGIGLEVDARRVVDRITR